MEKGYDDYLEKNNVEKGRILGQKYWIVKHPLQEYAFGALNGYIHFKTRPTIEKGYHGILTYVPVHGGITLARSDGKKGMIYGFDTGHCDSEKFQRTEKIWIKKQIGLMLRGILRAKLVEIPYLLIGYLYDFLGRFDSMRFFKIMVVKIQAQLVQFVNDTEKNNENALSLGVMINLLCGKF